jgi:ABC-2 type transport system permease protein/sodium transport system permease protein
MDAQSLRRWLRLARNELREILRDRRTIFTLALTPLLLYPLLGIGFHFLYGGGARASEGDVPVYRIGFETEPEGDLFGKILHRGQRLLMERTRFKESAVGIEQDFIPSFTLFVDSNLDERLRWGELDLAIRRIQPPQLDRRGRYSEYEIAYNSDSAKARDAVRFVQLRLLAVNLMNEETLRQFSGNELAPPIRLNIKAVAREENRRGFSLAVLVPLVLILMTMTGAVYPAIDLTAGERERGTLEMLMATPISREALLAAKYVAVLTVAVLTALINLAMMAITFVVLGRWMLAPESLGLSLGMIPVVLFLVVLFAAFYSAVLLALSSIARSFKEAQAYLVPLMLVSLLPGLLALVPNLHLSYGLALVPLLNIVLLARDLLSGVGSSGVALIVIVATVVYGYIALVLASRTFGAEAVLYSDGRSWLFDFFRRRRDA